MKVYRWLGVVGCLNEASSDDRVLAFGVELERLRKDLKWSTPSFPALVEPGRVRHLPLPLPLTMGIAGTPTELGAEIGLVDSVALDRSRRILAGGTIMVPDEGVWARKLLAGERVSVVPTVTGGDVRAVDVVRHPISRVFRPTTSTYMVHVGWQLKGVMVVDYDAFAFGSPYLRLGEPVAQPVAN